MGRYEDCKNTRGSQELDGGQNEQKTRGLFGPVKTLFYTTLVALWHQVFVYADFSVCLDDYNKIL